MMENGAKIKSKAKEDLYYQIIKPMRDNSIRICLTAWVFSVNKTVPKSRVFGTKESSSQSSLDFIYIINRPIHNFFKDSQLGSEIIIIIKSFEKVHIFDIESIIHKSLESRQEVQIVDLSSFDLPMILQHFYPTFLSLDHSNQICVVVNKEVQKWSYHYIKSICRITIAVNGQVDVDWNHRIIYDGTRLFRCYKGSIKILTRMNSKNDSTARSTKNLIRF